MELRESKLRRTLTLEENPQNALLNAIGNKNKAQIQKLLSEGKVDINCKYGDPFYKQLLHIACCEFAKKTDAECIKMLLKAGANPLEYAPGTQRNALHFAAEGGNVEILRAILEKLAEENADLTDSTVILNLVEYIFDADLNEGDFIKVLTELLKTNINVNIPDIESGWTVVYMAAKYKFKKIIETLINIKGGAIHLDNFKDHKGKTARDLIVQFNLYPESLPECSDENSNITPHTLYKDLRDRSTEEFRNNYEIIHDNLTDAEMSNLLCMAIDNNLQDVVSFLVADGANVDEKNELFQYNPLELALRRGNQETVKILVHSASSATISQALIDLAKGSYADRDQSVYDDLFNVILNSPKLKINYQDKNRSTCLHYSARYKPSNVTLEILKQGASLASKDSANKLAVADIKADTLRNHLDRCIYYTNPECVTSDKDACLTVDLRCLLPPRRNTVELNEGSKPKVDNHANETLLATQTADSCKVNIANQTTSTPITATDLCTETEVLQYMCDSNELKHLLKHPVILIFLYLKWYVVGSFFYMNFLIYNIFLLSLLTYITAGYHGRENPDIAVLSAFSYGLLVLTFVILVIREVCQLVIVGTKYFVSYENWLEIVLLNVTAVILVLQLDKETRPFVAIAIVTSAIEFLLLIGHFPAMSTNIMMLRSVSHTFFKLLLWYSILLFAFAYSFYMLFQENELEKDKTDPNANNDDDEEQDFFLNPGMSLLKTIIMLTGEFDAGSIKFNTYPVTSQVIFVAFVFLITIVLFNLLNGLAVSDTQIIKSDAELYGQIHRVENISQIERALLKYNLVKWLPSVRRVCMFPINTDEAKLFIYPNQNCKVVLQEDQKDAPQLCWFSCVTIHLDRKIERAIRNLLDEVNAAKEQNDKEADISRQISSIKTEIENLKKILLAKVERH